MATSNEFKLKRPVTMAECPWLRRDLPEGLIVYRYHGHTYGCIADGDAFTLQDGITPFFELPKDSVEPSN